jgi:predicted ATP-binding protein involved in virulence
MYIDKIKLKDFRTFKDAHINFVHQSTAEAPLRYPNINVVLGNNGHGKTTLLKAISLACLGPAIGDSGIYPYRLIRKTSDKEKTEATMSADISAEFTLHKQDRLNGHKSLSSTVKVLKRGDLESLRSDISDEFLWDPIFSEKNDAFFFVGYGATRTVEKSDKVDFGSRTQSSFLRARRIKSLFEETYSLVPLNSWLPELHSQNPGRYKQVFNLINRLLGSEHFTFEGEMEDSEYLFNRKGSKVPFPALSDGYRAFLGWIGDLLYNITLTCPSGEKLVNNSGIVLIDEIDLHLHPQWQMSILPKLSEALPNIQFIVTTHSPLVVGSVDTENIIAIKPGPYQSSSLKRIKQPTTGLDADQILLTEYFGLTTTVSDEKSKLLKELTEKARHGDVKAAADLLTVMTTGHIS